MLTMFTTLPTCWW